MKRNSLFSFGGIILISVLLLVASEKKNSDLQFQEQAKLGLRDVGHKLLNLNGDTTSQVLPILKIDEAYYKLSFQAALSLSPKESVETIESKFYKAGLPDQYRIEVIRKKDGEVAYSYELKNDKETDIVPCFGRELPLDEYDIKVRFTSIVLQKSNQPTFIYISLMGLFGFMVFSYYRKDKHNSQKPIENKTYSIGKFGFNAEQNKLFSDQHSFSLSKKECEILEILVLNINLIVSREQLNKEVWEDKGVIVGRSLDTYISKLRKKLEGDPLISIKNIHGIGYKLEIS